MAILTNNNNNSVLTYSNTALSNDRTQEVITLSDPAIWPTIYNGSNFNLSDYFVIAVTGDKILPLYLTYTYHSQDLTIFYGGEDKYYVFRAPSHTGWIGTLSTYNGNLIIIMPKAVASSYMTQGTMITTAYAATRVTPKILINTAGTQAFTQNGSVICYGNNDVQYPENANHYVIGPSTTYGFDIEFNRTKKVLSSSSSASNVLTSDSSVLYSGVEDNTLATSLTGSKLVYFPTNISNDLALKDYWASLISGTGAGIYKFLWKQVI